MHPKKTSLVVVHLLVVHLLVLGLLVVPASGAEVKIFRTESRAAVLEGTPNGVSVDPQGGLRLARQVERLATIEEPFVFAAAGHPKGWVVGTGNSGKVFRIDAEGGVKELFDAEEPEVFAVWTDPDGTVFAGTSPDGKVYRLRDEGAEVFFDPPETYIWALARDAKGRLVVATGLAGRIYRLRDDGEAELIFESDDFHVRALRLLADGSLLAGTAGQGHVLRLDTSAGTTTVTTLFDAAQPEILSFAVRDDGGAYAAALASEASLVDLSKTVATSAGEGEEGTVTVVVQGDETVGSRGAGDQGPRSVVLEISPDGQVTERLRFADETVHALLWHDGELWIGTGQEGHLYRYRDERLILERDLGERQVVGLVAGGRGAAAVATNSAAVYRIADVHVAEGTYTSSVLDAGQVARFGSFRWEGELPSGSSVGLEVRSGLSAEPDATWSPWSQLGDGTGQHETPLATVPHGRYVQWRATFRGNAERGPAWRAAELSYRQENQRPRIDSLEVLDPGAILVPSSFNPQNQTFEPWSPNREGIFTTLRPELEGNGNGLKNLWKKGFRTVRWQASDPNDDQLEYTLGFRRDGTEDPWLPIVTELDETYYSFDATVLPDGVYRFRVSATDRPVQAAEALDDDEVSEAVVIDHSVPELVRRERRGGQIEVELRDAWSPLRAVSYSVDAQDWVDAVAADGLLDSRQETVRVPVPDGTRLILLRVRDAAFNVVAFDLSAP